MHVINDAERHGARGAHFSIYYSIEVRTKYEHTNYEFVVRNFVTNSYFGGIIKINHRSE
ncbi:MAG: hypothetical protein HY738_02520 [Bacteroidia bacterium]|nr:hypothetical protein [Bacteroidia bacterium]